MAGPATDPGFLEPGGEDLGIRGRKLLRVIPPSQGKGESSGLQHEGATMLGSDYGDLDLGVEEGV